MSHNLLDKKNTFNAKLKEIDDNIKNIDDNTLGNHKKECTEIYSNFTILGNLIDSLYTNTAKLYLEKIRLSTLSYKDSIDNVLDFNEKIKINDEEYKKNYTETLLLIESFNKIISDKNKDKKKIIKKIKEKEKVLEDSINSIKKEVKIVSEQIKHESLYLTAKEKEEKISKMLNNAILDANEIAKIKENKIAEDEGGKRVSKYFDDDYLDKYIDKDEDEIDGILNHKTEESLKLELKKAIQFSIDTKKDNENLKFWKTFPFWGIFILIIIIGIILFTQRRILEKSTDKIYDPQKSLALTHSHLYKHIATISENDSISKQLSTTINTKLLDTTVARELYKYDKIKSEDLDIQELRRTINTLQDNITYYKNLSKEIKLIESRSSDDDYKKEHSIVEDKIKAYTALKKHLVSIEKEEDSFYKLGVFLYKSQLFFVFAMVSLSILIIIILFIIVRYVRKSGEDIITENKSGHRRIKDSIETYLKPSVSVRVGLPDVIKEATKVLNDVKNEKNGFIIYYGAPALSGLENDEDLYDYEGMTDQKSENVTDLLKNYREAKTNVNHANIEIHRYIKIITKDEFNARSSKLQKRYKNWVQAQIDLLKAPASKYKIHDSIRAPRWGSSQSYILTNNSYLHIIGQGNAAIHIKGKMIVEQIKTKMADAIQNAQKEINRPQPYSLDKLNNYLENEINKKKIENFEQNLDLEIAYKIATISEKELTIENIESHEASVKKQKENIKTSLDKQRSEKLKFREELDRLNKQKELLDKIGYSSINTKYDKRKNDFEDFNEGDKVTEFIQKYNITSLKEIVAKLETLGINSQKQLNNISDDRSKTLLFEILNIRIAEGEKKFVDDLIKFLKKKD